MTSPHTVRADSGKLPFPADWTTRETAHYNGGKEWFGYGGQCIQEPRLGYIDRYYRATRDRVRTWKVDGQDCADADAAWAALQVPVVVTDEERAALKIIGDEPADYRRAIDHEITHFLRAKGLIEYGPPGRCKRTDAGRDAADLADGVGRDPRPPVTASQVPGMQSKASEA